MSWSIYAKGTVAGVREYVELATASFYDSGEQAAFDGAKKLILGQVDAIQRGMVAGSGTVAGVDVRASGHMGMASVSVETMPIALASTERLETAPPPPPAPTSPPPA